MGLFDRQDVPRPCAGPWRHAPSEDQTPTCLALADIDADQRRFGGRLPPWPSRGALACLPDGFVVTTSACRRLLSASR
jgi:hypothetical protein